ncbi:MAG: hypothetical protein GF400_04380 [Candidatus Eisenbacteria bacterium]|nr:hypothetical protein [Candidatus Eisenbacteria bacterium]
MTGNGALVLMAPSAMDRAFHAPGRDPDFALDRRDALRMLLTTLPPRHASAVRLFYFSALSAREVAEEIGETPVRARQVLADAEAMMQGLAHVCFPRLCVNGGGG